MTRPEHGERPRVPGSPRILGLVAAVLGWSIVFVGAVIAVTAVGARTVRQYGEPGQWGATIATDGIRWFQGVTLLCVLGTGMVLIAAALADLPRWWLLPLPIAGLLFVAGNTSNWKRDLLDEGAGPRSYPAEIPVRASDGGPTLDAMGRPLHFETVTRSYEINIPEGLDVMIVGSVIVAGLIALLMVLWLIEHVSRRRERRIRPMVGTV